jgi:sulfur-carrier protein
MVIPTENSVPITVRYFAAAQSAAGSDSADIGLRPGTTLEHLIDELSGTSAGLARVLARCSFLCDGVAVRDRAQVLVPGTTIDVLPPFAGG